MSRGKKRVTVTTLAELWDSVRWTVLSTVNRPRSKDEELSGVSCSSPTPCTHTFGMLAVEAWPLHDVRAYMGHADIQTTMIYVRHVPKAAAADKLSKLVALASGDTSRDTVGTRWRTSFPECPVCRGSVARAGLEPARDGL
jgi:hypothetical protein